MRLFQSKEKKQQIETARSTYSEFARSAAASDPEQAHELAATFKETSELGALSEKERRERSIAGLSGLRGERSRR